MENRDLPFASAASVKFHLLSSISTKIVFYFIFLLFYCRMYKKKKKVCVLGGGGGGGGGVCSNADNGI